MLQFRISDAFEEFVIDKSSHCADLANTGMGQPDHADSAKPKSVIAQNQSAGSETECTIGRQPTATFHYLPLPSMNQNRTPIDTPNMKAVIIPPHHREEHFKSFNTQQANQELMIFSNIGNESNKSRGSVICQNYGDFEPIITNTGATMSHEDQRMTLPNFLKTFNPDVVDLISDDEKYESSSMNGAFMSHHTVPQAKRKNTNEPAAQHFNKKQKVTGEIDTAERFECEFCAFTSTRKKGLAAHARTHNGRSYECEFCKKRFSRRGNRDNHVKLHEKIFAFQCSQCSLGFLQENLWKFHESSCTAKQYCCYLCNMNFYRRKTHLTDHMRRIHTREKPFGCSVCLKRFYGKHDLNYHMACIHKNDN